MPTRPLSLAQRQTQIKRNRRKADALNRRMTQEAVDLDRLRSSVRWQKLRAIVRRAQPTCADPFNTHKQTGIVTPSREVHHVIGAALEPERFFEMANLVALCSRCHALIGAREKKGWDTAQLFSRVAR